MASYINKIYSFLIEVQSDAEPVFTGNDLIAYDTPKGLAGDGGLPSLGLVSTMSMGIYETTGPDRLQIDCPTPSLLAQPEPLLKPTASAAAVSNGEPRQFTDINDLPVQRPPLMRLFSSDPHMAQEASESTRESSPQPNIPVSQSWASVIAKRNAPKMTPLIIPSRPSRPLEIPKDLPAPLSPRAERAQEMRVVWIHGCPPRVKLADISKLIREGPLRSISFSKDPKNTATRVARLVFYFAKDAARFLEATKFFRPETWVKDLQFTAGEPFPDGEELRMMDPPLSARRRLTIVRAGLFDNLEAKTIFHIEVYHIVRRAAVELIFFYSQGNATIVLDSVVNAVKLKAYFDHQANVKDSRFSGVRVTFSKDPCEQGMRLISGPANDRRLRVLRAEMGDLVESRSRTAGRDRFGTNLPPVR
jgi:hypothetical protein